MAKETVRYPDALVARVEAVVAEVDAFESKSEFYRFASDFLLSVLDPEHDPTVLGYGDIVADLESATDGRLVSREGSEEPTTGPFLDAYIQVRRHLLYEDVEAARAVVTDRYDATDREALLLDEVIGRSAVPGRDPARQPEPAPRSPEERSEEYRQEEYRGREHRQEDARREEYRQEAGHEDPVDTDGTRPDGETADDSGERSTRQETHGRRTEVTRETDGGTDTSTDEDV